MVDVLHHRLAGIGSEKSSYFSTSGICLSLMCVYCILMGLTSKSYKEIMHVLRFDGIEAADEDGCDQIWASSQIFSHYVKKDG